jgi:hypothetical protein
MFGLSTLNTVEEFELDDVRSKVAFAKKILNREQENLKAYLYDRGFWNDTIIFFKGR